MGLEIRDTLGESPGVKKILFGYVLPTMGLFTVADFIGKFFDQNWPYRIFAIAFLFAYLGTLLIIYPRKKKIPETKKIEFKPDGEHFYGYKKQEEEFRQVIEQATLDNNTNRILPIISVIGTSGVGKSSFLLHYFDKKLKATPPKAIYINLREGFTSIRNEFKKFFQNPNCPIEHVNSEGMKQWLSDEVCKPVENTRLKETVLIIDQFEQILSNDLNVAYVKNLIESLADKCYLIILSSRSDILGDTIYGVRQRELFSAVSIYQRIRLFVLTSVEHPGSQEQILYEGIFEQLFKRIPEEPELFKELAEASWHRFGNRCTLPIYIKLILYALFELKITTTRSLKNYFKGKPVQIDLLINPFFEKKLKAAGNERTAYRILFAMSKDGGLSERYTCNDLKLICGVQQGEDPIEASISKLEKIGLLVRISLKDDYSIVHEHLGEISARNSRRILSLEERDQIVTRQTFLKKCAKKNKMDYFDTAAKEFLDSRSHLGPASVESYIALGSILLVCFRLFFWPPYKESWFHFDGTFLPPALLMCAGSFYSTCLFGNIGKPIRCYQPQVNHVCWQVVLWTPVISLLIILFWPEKWLLFAAIATLVLSGNQLLTGRWATIRECEDIGHLFKRYSCTGLALSAGLLLLQFMLDNIEQKASESALPLMVSIVLYFGFIRFAITWWSGRNQRNILARIDAAIVIQEAIRKIESS